MKEFQCCGKLPRCTTYDRTLKTSDITLCKCFHRLFCFNGKQQNDCNHGTIEQNPARHGACSPAGRRRKQDRRASDTCPPKAQCHVFGLKTIKHLFSTSNITIQLPFTARIEVRYLPESTKLAHKT